MTAPTTTLSNNTAFERKGTADEKQVSTIADDDSCKTETDLSSSCDACPHCADVCDHALECPSCQLKQQHQQGFFTPCQVRRHNHVHSAWLIAGNSIYDATSYLHCHPAGEASILARAGGHKDVTRDLSFHSRSTRKTVESMRVGTLVPCGTLIQEQGRARWRLW